VAGRHQALPNDDSRVVEIEYRTGFDRGQTAPFFDAFLQPAQRDKLTFGVTNTLIATVWQAGHDRSGCERETVWLAENATVNHR
jgi:hypothetical protein